MRISCFIPCLPYSPPIHPTTESFEKGLTDWLNDPTVTGDKSTAVHRIREAFHINREYLSLEDLKLSSLPKQIGQLKKLTTLLLSYNHLTTFPAEIGQLSKLTRLSATMNYLASLPAEIGRLSELENLSLHNNRLVSIPAEIGQLANLKWLLLGTNKLTSLPPEFGQLSNLIALGLSFNTLTSLSPEIGMFLNLQALELHCNKNLNELPISLGNLPGLTYINVYGTGIPRATIEAILRQCRSNREAQAATALPDKLATWQAIGKNKKDLSQIQEFTESEKMILHEWLVRLERTQDFSTCQSSLANTVCDILASVISNDEFKALFFNQAEANNSHCEDRAAMSLNEIYLAWKILCMPEETPLKEKLTLMTGCAKTLSLRKEIGKLYFHYHENVEVYLYCERVLKERLGLVTAIQDMTYPDFAKRNSIEPEKLVSAVNSNFFDELNEIPIFEKTLKQDPEMAKKFDEITDRFQKKLEKGKISQSNQLMEELEKEKKQAALKWYKQKI